MELILFLFNPQPYMKMGFDTKSLFFLEACNLFLALLYSAVFFIVFLLLILVRLVIHTIF